MVILIDSIIKEIFKMMRRIILRNNNYKKNNNNCRQKKILVKKKNLVGYSKIKTKFKDKIIIIKISKIMMKIREIMNMIIKKNNFNRN